jgi:hypothetical protein
MNAFSNGCLLVNPPRLPHHPMALHGPLQPSNSDPFSRMLHGGIIDGAAVAMVIRHPASDCRLSTCVLFHLSLSTYTPIIISWPIEPSPCRCISGPALMLHLVRNQNAFSGLDDWPKKGGTQHIPRLPRIISRWSWTYYFLLLN